MKLRIGVLAIVLVAAACGGDDADDAPATTAAPTTAAETTSAPAETTTTAAVAGGSVAVAASSLGDILVDGDGNSLYLFVPDAQGASTCYDGCAEAWPPLVGEVTAGGDVDAGLLGAVARDDGSEQVTYNGWPLYYFAADASPGDTSGQGVNDVWYVLDTNGNAVEG